MPAIDLDTAFYLHENPDVAAAGVDPQWHYVTFGEREGRRPADFFDPIHYLRANPDVADAVRDGSLDSAYAHFLTYGMAEGRTPSQAFDPAGYLAFNTDVAAAVEAGDLTSAVAHFVRYGRFEDRVLGPADLRETDVTSWTPEDTTVRVDLADALSVPAAIVKGVEITRLPDLGTLDVANGTLIYTPATDWSGSTTLDYTLQLNDTLQMTGTLTITVTPVNDAPVARADTATTEADRPLMRLDVIANDSDPDPDGLTGATIDIVSSPRHGAVDVNADGTLTYTPASGYSGRDTFDYRVSDSDGASDTAGVMVTVAAPNAAPVAGNDIAVTEAGTPLTVDVLANDTDPDGDPLAVATVRTSVEGGRVVILDNDTISYTPPMDYVGSDRFTYTVSDGEGGSDTGRVDLTVEAPPTPAETEPETPKTDIQPTTTSTRDTGPLTLAISQDAALADYASEIDAAFRMAWSLWADHLDHTAQIEVTIDYARDDALASAGSSLHHTGRQEDGVFVVETAVAQEFRTGRDANGEQADGFMTIHTDPATFDFRASLDEAVEPDRIDAVTLFTHEIGHMFGYLSYRDGNGDVTGSYQTVFDTFIEEDNGTFVFAGPGVMAEGGPVEVVTGTAHFADSGLLMNPYISPGTEKTVSDVDVAVLADLGLSVSDGFFV